MVIDENPNTSLPYPNTWMNVLSNIEHSNKWTLPIIKTELGTTDLMVSERKSIIKILGNTKVLLLLFLKSILSF